MDLSTIGPGAHGGSHRLALSKNDVAARSQFISWIEAAGCSWWRDWAGNLFACREGTEPSLAPVAVGSHLDTQPSGGRFDGILGVLAGLEAFRTLNAHDIQTRRPLLLINWTNEEGSRFSPAMGGSAVYAGRLSLETFCSKVDRDNTTLGNALETSGQRGTQRPGDMPLNAYLELHIEQGPVLEEGDYDLGIVTGIQGTRWYDVRFQGQPNHAGTTPMSMRHDALAAASDFMFHARCLAEEDETNRTRITFGELEVIDSSRNVIPGEVQLTIDVRHEDDDRMKAIDDKLRKMLEDAKERHGISATLDLIWDSPTTWFAREIVTLLTKKTKERGFEAPHLLSGAGHDAANTAHIAPTGMLFVPCRDGISHNEAEYCSPEHCAIGAQLLLDSLITRANQ